MTSAAKVAEWIKEHIRLKNSAHFPLLKSSYGLVLYGALMGGGAAFAQAGHDHGNAKDQASAKDLANVHGHEHAQGQVISSTPIKEVALPDGLSSAQSMAIDSTGRLWFTEKVGKKLAMYDPEKKEFSTHSLPSSWGKMGFSNIVIGPEDDIWFTATRWVEGAEEPHIIGRFTPADGYFTKYAIPHNSVPEELFVDTKGTIWFTASNKNNLYRVDPKTFALKGYPIPTANSNPKSLAADQKGHIWFSESTVNKIGEFIPEQGVFYEHELLTQFANPGEISIDKQGRIWFVEVTANRIGVFSPDLKRFDEVIIPTPGSSPVALVNDDNGNVWFLEYKGNKVGVFNPEKATFHEYDIPSYGSLPANMVIDRKRSLLWFTQSATEAKKLGMISISEALAASNKQNNIPSSAENTSDEGMSKWLVWLAAIIAMATLGALLIMKAGKGKKS
ncbi:MAG: SMP-30/gluconolactonase/LRE family protein [Gallionella sp.]